MQGAIQALRQGELVVVPTETVYGLAANALDELAVKKIFEVKGRPLIDPLIVHVHSLEQFHALAQVNDLALRFAEAFWPGPLTLILPKQPGLIPDIVSAGMPTVGIRMPSHPLFRQLLQLVDLPLAAPSANPFGYVSPTTAEHVRGTLGEKVAHIIDGGECAIGLESTIVDLTNPEKPIILRPGPITPEDIKEKLDIEVPIAKKLMLSVKESQPAPGLLKHHYAPHARLVLVDLGEEVLDSEGVAVVRLAKPDMLTAKHEYWLSEPFNLEEVAHNLYALLQKLDKQGFKTIYMERPPEEGLGVALMNRLQRAAS